MPPRPESGTLGDNPTLKARRIPRRNAMNAMEQLLTFLGRPRFSRRERVRRTWEWIASAKDYVTSCYPAAKARRDFDTIRTYFTFIGIGRSGSTLIESLLDAHPNIICANRQNALRYFETGLFRSFQIYYLLIRNSRRMAAVNRRSGGYAYSVPNQWQGRYTQLTAIGDKPMMSFAISRLDAKPWLPARVVDVTGAELKLIHVIRNPYDVIATRSLRYHTTIEAEIAGYFATSATTVQVLNRLPHDANSRVSLFQSRHEAFIADPELRLRSLCAFLSVEVDDTYIMDCVGIVNATPHKSRFKVQWDAASIKKVQGEIQNIPFLSGYDYDA